MYFPEYILHILIITALVSIGISVIVLVMLFLKDIKTKTLW
jgi:hypothetical protein